jgi:hypothetical protein
VEKSHAPEKWLFWAVVSLALLTIACPNPGTPDPATYKVTYNVNGGSGSVPADPDTYLQGAAVTVLGNTGNMTKTGNPLDYSFAGWNTKADGSGASYAAGATLSLGSANVTLYVVWIVDELTFTSSGTSIVITGNNVSYWHSLAIPGGVTRIGDNAFLGCTLLDPINIPSSVTRIGQNAFKGCTSLQSVYVSAKTPPVLAAGSHAFDGCAVGFKIAVPAGCQAAYQAAPGWSDYETIIH